MKRDHPDAIEVSPREPLPASADAIIEILGPLVTGARLERMRQVIAGRTRSLVPVLEELHDPHNGAAILRSADAFGCHEVHLAGATLPFMISHKVSRGAERWLELHRHEDIDSCVRALHERSYEVFVAAMDGTLSVDELAERPRVAVVFGNEHRGLSETVCRAADGTYRVPMVGFVESLNVSVASAITLYVASRGRQGDLDEAARAEILARYLLASVRDGSRLVRERAAE